MCHLNFVIYDTRIQEQPVAITTGVGSGKKKHIYVDVSEIVNFCAKYLSA